MDGLREPTGKAPRKRTRNEEAAQVPPVPVESSPATASAPTPMSPLAPPQAAGSGLPVNPQAGPRNAPTALAAMDDGSGTGQSWFVRGQMGPKVGADDLLVTGWASDEAMIEAIRCSYTWARLHQDAILQCFSKGGVVPQAAQDLRAPGRMCGIELSKAGVRKIGASVGLAAACCFVRMLTGVGVESCVCLTGVVGMDGRIHRVGGIEAKLRYAAQAPGMSVVVLPEENRHEAEAVLQTHQDWNPLQLLPVRHMGEVIQWLFTQPVAQALASPSLAPAPVPMLQPDVGGVAVSRAMVLLEKGVGFSIIECAVLPGTGKQHIMGTSLPDRSPELHDQALRAIFWSMLISESSQSLHTPLVHRLHDPHSFDIYVMVRWPRVPGIGLAILCSLLAVAFDQTIDPSVLLAADLGIEGKLYSLAPVTMADLRSVAQGGGSKLLVSPTTAQKIADVVHKAREEGEEGLQGLDVISLESVCAQNQAALVQALWGGGRSVPT